MSTLITHYRAPRLTKERRTVGSQYSVNDITGMLLYSCDNCIQCHPVRYTVSERILIVVRPIPGLPLSCAISDSFQFKWRHRVRTFVSGETPTPMPTTTTMIQVGTKTTIRYDTHVYSASIHLDCAKSTRRMNSSPTRCIDNNRKVWQINFPLFFLRRSIPPRNPRDDSSLMILMFFMLNKNMLSLFPTW